MIENNDNSEVPDLSAVNQAIGDYFNGMLYGELADTSWGSQQLRRFALPFAYTAALYGSELATDSLEGEALQKKLEQCVRTGILTYVYSGVEVNPDLLLDMTDFIAKDDRWLKTLLMPTETTMAACAKFHGGALSPEHRAYYRLLSQDALAAVERARLARR